MDLIFAKILTEKGILGTNTKILANYKGYTLDGTEIPSQGELLIKQIESSESEFYVIATPLFGQNRYKIQLKDILEVDGMDPYRLGRVFNINSDGTDKIVGKKRGRKPKISVTP